MEYPCGMNYCGCNMTKISNCEDCYYRSTHKDMGASWNVCTLYTSLSSATIACEHSDNCKSKITYKEVNQAIEKQIPKKPEWIVVNVDYGAGYYEGPCCNRRVKESDDFCSKCGQHLDFDKT